MCLSGSYVNRSSIDIVIDILKSVEDEGVILKTHLLYRANLNSRSLEKFLSKLVSTGLLNIQKESGGRRKYYRISVRGRYLLRRLLVVRKMLNNRSKLFSNVVSELKRSEGKYNVKVIEGVRISGSSGTVYSFQLALTKKSNERGNNGNKVTTVEVIDEYLDMDDVIERISWTWLTSLDTSTRSIIVLPNRLYSRAMKFVESICRSAQSMCNHRPILVPYDITNTSESIANICTKIT